MINMILWIMLVSCHHLVSVVSNNKNILEKSIKVLQNLLNNKKSHSLVRVILNNNNNKNINKAKINNKKSII